MDFLPDGVTTCLYPKIQLDAVIDAMAWQASGFIRSNEPPYEPDFKIDLLPPGINEFIQIASDRPCFMTVMKQP